MISPTRWLEQGWEDLRANPLPGLVHGLVLALFGWLLLWLARDRFWLLAGAFSMGAGEYISVTSQRELFERELALEAEEIEAMPDEEANELALIYRAKGVGREEAEAMAARMAATFSVSISDAPFCSSTILRATGLSSTWALLDPPPDE